MNIIGIDAGATWIKAGVFAEDLSLEQRMEGPSGAAQGARAYVDSIAQVVHELGGGDRIGLALPALLSPDGQAIRYMANVQGLNEPRALTPLAALIGDRFKAAPFAAANDADCAALAEWQQGGGRADEAVRLLHLTWGTGIGTGFVVGGAMQYGWEGGHVPLSWGAPVAQPCGCGSVIDLEAHIAVPRLIAQAREYLTEQQQASKLTVDDLVDEHHASRILLPAAEQGDALAVAVFDEAVLWLARGILTMGVLVYPDIVTVGGGMMASDWLVERLREAVRHEGSGYSGDAVGPEMIHRAQLGNDAGMIGAAILAQRMLDT